MAESHRVEWAPAALTDVEEILEFIATREGTERAAGLLTKLEARIGSLGRSPRRGRVVPELKEVGVTEYREAIVGPYRVIFRIRSRVVGIVGVLDGRRDLEELLIRRAIES